MPVEIKDTLTAGLDQDSSYHTLRKNAYVDAENITMDSIALTNFDDLVTGLRGNRKVAYPLPTGTNKCIGAKADLIRNTILYFVYNSLGKHSILEYNNLTRIVSKILESKTDSGGTDILAFDQNKKIIHIEIVHRDEGDLLFWTDGNTAPKGCLKDKLKAGTYGVVDIAFIQVAKNMPLQSAVVAYGNDSTRTTNGLRKKVFQHRYRWKLDDFTFSCWSPYSEVPVPSNTVGNDNDLDSTKNNYISVQLATGKKNVTDIEVGFRTNNGDAWDDLVSAITLNKATLAIADDGVYQYNFYNDIITTPLDPREVNLGYDWVPLLAKSMCMPNGNVLVLAAITEGYDKIADNALSVTMTVTQIKNTGIDLGPPALTYSQNSFIFTFTVSGNVPTGTRYRVHAVIGGGGPSPIILSDYTSLVGESVSQVATGLYLSTNPTYRNTNTGAQYVLLLPSGSYITIVAVSPGSTSTTIATPTGLPWYSKYRYGLVYFNDQGRTNGVHSFINQAGGSNDFEIETGAFSLSAGIPQTAAVNLTISHLPPSWATKYAVVRSRNLTFDKMMMHVTCDFQSDGTYYYFGFENIKYFYTLTNTFVYASIRSVFGEGDRMRVIASADSSGYTGTVWANQDYAVLGIVTRQLTGGSSTDLGDFIKVKTPVSAPSPAFSSTTMMQCMIYTPAEATANPADDFYWEFGQFNDIYSLGGVNYHRGQTQDQTSILSANFQFTTAGDYYYRNRLMYNKVVSPTFQTNLLLFDQNFSDYFKSKINSNGRSQILDPNAKQTFFPATMRFGEEIQPNTNINGLNRFYGDNFKDYNRSFGSILKMVIQGQYIHVGQELKIGTIPVDLQIIHTLTADKQLIASEELLNQITYYEGEFGIGDTPESWAIFGHASYGVDNRKGVIWRLSLDGLIPISTIYKMYAWGYDNLRERTGNYKIYGAFDLKHYILALEQTPASNSQTLAFNEAQNRFQSEGQSQSEDQNCFRSFYSFHPEMMVTLGNLLVTFKNGELWTHDNDTKYCNFYGVQYYPSVKLVFNEQPMIRKSFLDIGYQSNQTWTSNDNGDIKTSMVNPQTKMQQISQLKAVDFEKDVGRYNAAFLKDANSMVNQQVALCEGDFLWGDWISVKLTYVGSDFAWLHSPYIIWQPINRIL